MNLNDYKRDFKYKSDEGNNKSYTWLMIVCAVIVIVLALLTS